MSLSCDRHHIVPCPLCDRNPSLPMTVDDVAHMEWVREILRGTISDCVVDLALVDSLISEVEGESDKKPILRDYQQKALDDLMKDETIHKVPSMSLRTTYPVAKVCPDCSGELVPRPRAAYRHCQVCEWNGIVADESPRVKR